MKKLNLLYLLISALIFGSCKDDTFGNYGEYSEGEPAMLVGSIKVPTHKKIESRAMGQERETAIEQLAIIAWEINSGRRMAIDLTGKVANRKWTSDGASIYDLTESISVVTGHYRAYFIANWKSFYGRKNTDGTELTFEELSNMSEEEIQQLTFWNYGDHIDLYGNDGFPMTQVIDETYNNGNGFVIDTGNNTLKDIYLTRASAHIHFQIYNGNDGITDESKKAKYTGENVPLFTPQRYAVFRAPSHTNAFKEGENGVTILKENTFDQGYFPITKSTEDTYEHAYEFDFHMLENRQPVVEGLSSIADRERWDHTAATPPNVDLGKEALSYSDRKFTNAPEGATFVVIEGTYSGPAEKRADGTYSEDKYIGNVTYIIHLGNFNTSSANTDHPGSFGDFSVLRNERQLYKINVQGANAIVVNVDVSKPDENNPAIEGDLSQQPVAVLDAHYSKVMLQITSATIKPEAEKNTVAITSYKNGFTNTVYTLEQLENAALDIDYKWVQFQKPTKGINEFPQYAGVAHHTEANKRSDRDTDNYYGYITDLIRDLAAYKANPKTYTPKYATVDGDNFYVAAFVDDNVYQDLTGKTQIKEWAGVAARDRRIALNPEERKVSPNETSILSGVASINIRQKPVISTYSLNQTGTFANYNPFGLEQVMEPTATVKDGKLQNIPQVNGTTMRVTDKGKNYILSEYNYFDNTYWWDSHFTTTTSTDMFADFNAKNPQANTRQWFPRFDQGLIEDDYKTFYKKNSTGSYVFVPADDYNTVSKALVVHNRDLNGDGKIQGDELQWYVAGYVQFLIYNYGYNLIPEELRLQQTALEKEIAKNYPTTTDFDLVFPRYFTSGEHLKRLYWQDQRGSTSLLNRPGIDTYETGDNKWWMPQLNRLRLARNLGQFKNAATAEYTLMSQHHYAGDDTHQNNIRYLNPNIARNYNVTGFYPFHYCTDVINRLPYALEYCTTPIELWTGSETWGNNNLRKNTAEQTQKAIYELVIEKFNENSDLTSTYGRATEYNDATKTTGKLPAGWRVPNQRELLSLFVINVPRDLLNDISTYKNSIFFSCSYIVPTLYSTRDKVPVILSAGVITLSGEGFNRNNGYVVLVRDVDPYTGEPIAESKAVEYSGKVGRGILIH